MIENLDYADDVAFYPCMGNPSGLTLIPNNGLDLTRGAVDLYVSPRSSAAGSTGPDSCGVRSLHVSILKQIATTGLFASLYRPYDRDVFNWSDNLLTAMAVQMKTSILPYMVLPAISILYIALQIRLMASLGPMV